MAIERQSLQLDIVFALGFALLLSACGTSRRAVKRLGQARTTSPSASLSRSGVPTAYPRGEAASRAYIERYKALAMHQMKRYKIPASITLAQGIFESNSGLSTLARQANNHFGIKCHDWRGPSIRHDDDAKGECFRKYANADESFLDHALFLTERKRYQGLFKLRRDDYRGWAYGLKQAGYATDKHYPERLIALVERYRLQRFDQQVLRGKAFQKNPPQPPLSQPAALGLREQAQSRAVPLAEDRIDENF